MLVRWFLFFSWIFVIGCQEKNVPYKNRHRHSGAEEVRTIPPEVKTHVYTWESKLAKGEYLMRPDRITIDDFVDFRVALLQGVFDPDTVLTNDQISTLGPTNCTQATKDAGIGVARFSRTLATVPEFALMQDRQGLTLKDWLVALNRKDLLDAYNAFLTQLKK